MRFWPESQTGCKTTRRNITKITITMSNLVFFYVCFVHDFFTGVKESNSSHARTLVCETSFNSIYVNAYKCNLLRILHPVSY